MDFEDFEYLECIVFRMSHYRLMFTGVCRSIRWSRKSGCLLLAIKFMETSGSGLKLKTELIDYLVFFFFFDNEAFNWFIKLSWFLWIFGKVYEIESINASLWIINQTTIKLFEDSRCLIFFRIFIRFMYNNSYKDLWILKNFRFMMNIYFKIIIFNVKNIVKLDENWRIWQII